MMTSQEFAQVLTPLTEQVRRIAEALEWLALQQTPEPTEPEPAGTCPHPMDTRIALGATALGEAEWICGICQHRAP